MFRTKTTCRACTLDSPCAQHELGLDAAAILATVARETRPYNDPAGRGVVELTETDDTSSRHRPLGLCGRAGGWLR